MALTKETVVDKIEVMEMGQVQVRTVTRVKEDGALLSSSFHRHILDPSTKASGSWADTNISGEDARVQAVANATWTDSVKTAYRAMIDANSL
jgi:K+-transporting ATPase c subunit